MANDRKAAANNSAGKTLTVRQTRSQARRPAVQEATLRGWVGEDRPPKTLEDTPSIRGMIRKVAHLVEVGE